MYIYIFLFRYCAYVYIIYTTLDIARCPDIFQREVLSDEAFWAEGLTEYLGGGASKCSSISPIGESIVANQITSTSNDLTRKMVV